MLEENCGWEEARVKGLGPHNRGSHTGIKHSLDKFSSFIPFFTHVPFSLFDFSQRLD